ncbi:zinc-dependent alcohol dehydrogenase [Rhodococcoides kyotonense]|uniref:Threonine dehydrogenase n=1 Tax=Rhodococcoides kyotonense TaxID=398843 RepID=A0A239LZ80_9NOCA|nr:alcohol dehydrogenase catalytic domain-containing protein [Rhodococcus kyotonensis]SNT35816.1 Threonine dehydrogenase [Rhodococcus kyotonensis]
MVGTEVSTVRRILVEGIDEVSVESVSTPDAGAGEVRVRSTVVGICGSDIHAAHGRHPFIDLPFRPGHEVVGVVDATGDGADASLLGKRVVVEPNLACGQCTQCRAGRYNICAELAVFGCQTPGGLTDAFTIAEDRVIPLADELDDRHAALIEPLATPVHAVRRAAGLVGGLDAKRVVVFGAGPIGLFVLLAARRAGAIVVVADLLDSKRARAERLGAVGSFDPTTSDAVTAAKDALGGPADVVIDCVARESSVAQAVDIVDKGGAVLIVGVAAGSTPVPLDLIQDREIILAGCLMYVRSDVQEAIDMLTEGVVPIDEFVTAEYPLERAAEAFAASTDPEHVKVLITVGDRP